MMFELQPDEVGRIDRVIPPVGERRDRKSRQKPFPEIPGKKSEKGAPKDPPPTERRPPPTQDDDDHTIDLLVGGLLLPRRQSLPGSTGPIPLH